MYVELFGVYRKDAWPRQWIQPVLTARPLVTDLPESDKRRALLWMPDFVATREK
jgi:hypothetical protein